MLARLRHVTQVGFISIWAVTCRQRMRESWPGGICPPFDGCQPCGFDREAQRGMEVHNKSRDAGEVVRSSVGSEVVTVGGCYGWRWTG